jgi:hypothetical protein
VLCRLAGSTPWKRRKALRQGDRDKRIQLERSNTTQAIAATRKAEASETKERRRKTPTKCRGICLPLEDYMMIIKKRWKRSATEKIITLKKSFNTFIWIYALESQVK